MAKTTWQEHLKEAMAYHNETEKDIVESTFSMTEFTKPFDDGYGGTEGDPFTLWTKSRVYFPVCYDGSEWISSVSRNPDGVPTRHVGG